MERNKLMDNNQAESHKPLEAELQEAVQPEAEPAEDGYIIRRPKRAKLSAEESLRRMQAFKAERMENFIASVRKSKS